MRAFVLTGPGTGAVQEVAPPRPAPGQVVVDVARVGLCGTDVEFFTGEMAYLHQGDASYPLQLGHEWCGTVTALGSGVDPTWLGTRVTGDTMLGCGHCERCLGGRPWVCDDRAEIGIRRGFPGALAEQLAVPASALHALPDVLDDAAGAMVEPGGNAVRAISAAGLSPGERLLVLGTGTIGLLVALIGRAAGAEVHVLGRDSDTLALARELDLDGVWTHADLPDLPWHAVVDASNAAELPGRALDLVEPGRHLVWIGLSGTPSCVDTRTVALKDVTAVGILGGSAGLAGAIEAYASGAVDPRPLVCATVGLGRVADVLGGWRPDGSGGAHRGPKVHVDPRRTGH